MTTSQQKPIDLEPSPSEPLELYEDDSDLFWANSCGLGFVSCAIASFDQKDRPSMSFGESKK
jgi:hypothetical protein